MQRIQLSQDIRPLSEFRANVSLFIEQVHKTNRPLIITQHGKSTAVLLNVKEYETILEKLELMEDVQSAERQLNKGESISHKDAKKRTLSRLQR